MWGLGDFVPASHSEQGKDESRDCLCEWGVLWVSLGSPPSDQIRESGESWGNAADSRSSAAP